MVLQDYDFVAHLTRFCRALRGHGLLVGPQETADAIAAVERAGLMSEARIYWSLRALLVSRREQFPTFDRLFSQFWNFEPVSARPETDGGPRRVSDRRARWGDFRAGWESRRTIRTRRIR